jgi:peptidoglycan/LPS O-acetylase OafA/YrhL
VSVLITAVLMEVPFCLGLFNLLSTNESSLEANALVIAWTHIAYGIFFAAFLFLLDSSSIQFIKSNVWRISGRLSYCIYLIHPILLTVMTSRQEPIDLSAGFVVSDPVQLQVFLVVLLSSISLSIFLHLMVEVPFINLQKLIVTANQKKGSLKVKTKVS